MGKTRIGINGMGRIGRTIIRELFNRNLWDSLEITGVNNPGDLHIYAHLLKHDSIHGHFEKKVEHDDKNLIIDGKRIPFFNFKDPHEIPWSDHEVDMVIDATGVFKDRVGLGRHIGGTVKKVIMCAPGKNLDGTFVVGINHHEYDNAKHNIVSNASCTTNCLAPVAKVLHDTWGIETGFMTTVHSYTSDQELLDGSHKDLRRARAAALSMIPTTTGAAKAVGQVIPSLKGKLDGYAIRVPTPNVSLVDLTAVLKKPATAEEINKAMKLASETNLKGLLAYTEEELVSIDFMSTRVSATLDAGLTNVIGNTIKVVAWYDNESGFSNRVIDLAKYMGEQLK